MGYGDVDKHQAMSFWERHPLIDNLDLGTNSRESVWFSEEIPPHFLPNLRYLRVTIDYYTVHLELLIHSTTAYRHASEML